MKCVFKHKNLQMFGLKLKAYMTNFSSLEVVDRDYFQVPVGEDLN